MLGIGSWHDPLIILRGFKSSITTLISQACNICRHRNNAFSYPNTRIPQVVSGNASGIWQLLGRRKAPNQGGNIKAGTSTLLAEDNRGIGVFHRAAGATFCTFRSNFTALHPLNHCPWAGRGKHSKAGTHSKQVFPPVLLANNLLFRSQLPWCIKHKQTIKLYTDYTQKMMIHPNLSCSRGLPSTRQ